MKRIVKAAALIAALRWGVGAFTEYRLETPSCKRILECFCEAVEAIADVVEEVRLVDQNSESCSYFSGSSFR